jgi:hypothetical protein
MRNVAPSNRLGPPCNRPVYCWGDLERASDCEAGHIESIVVVFFLRPFALSMAETPNRIQGRESCKPWNQTPAPSVFFVVHRPYDGTDAQLRRHRYIFEEPSSGRARDERAAQRNNYTSERRAVRPFKPESLGNSLNHPDVAAGLNSAERQITTVGRGLGQVSVLRGFVQ